MKTFKIIGTVTCLLLFFLVSCSHDTSKQLARTWAVSDMETSTDLQDSVKTKMMVNSQIVFTKDGHYTSSGGIGADQGTYSVDKDGKNLSTISDAGKESSVYVIDKLTDNDLVLKNNGNTVTFTAKK